MVQYAKGEKPRNMDAACGGLVLERLRSFAKEDGGNDDLHALGTGTNGPGAVMDYGKKGAGTTAETKRTGDKCAAVIKPRK